MKAPSLASASLSLALLASCGPADATAVDSAGVEQDTARIDAPAPLASRAREVLLVDGESALQRVVVIGASMSDGYGLEVGLDEVLDAMILREHDLVEANASTYFFTSPRTMGPDAVELASDLDPTLVVGIDFLFWFGYGSVNRDGKPLASEDERLDLLEIGLSLLDELHCPLVVGDFPNMADAVGGMLDASQLPEPGTLVRLNRRLRGWAAERASVAVVGLSDAVTALRSNRAFAIGRLSYPAGSTSSLLQADHLHPTLEGMTVIAHLIGLEILGLGLASDSDLELDPAQVLPGLNRETGEAR